MATLGFLVVVVVVVGGAVAQIPIPKREVGFVFMSGSPSAPVHFDFYIDQICPLSKKAWPTILKLAMYYGPDKMKLTTHLFPLPYHRNSFYASKGSHIINKDTGGNMTYKWIQTIFDMQSSLVNNATINMPDSMIVQKFAGIAATVFGLDSDKFASMLTSDPTIEMNTRLGWKYCCTRGVAHTPTFMVNDVVVNGDPTWTVADWRFVIDPLLHKIPTGHQIKDGADCDPGLKKCEYLPGKFECCKVGEFCIPNVGCRC